MAWGQTPEPTNPDDMVEITVDGVKKNVHRESTEAIAARDAALAKHEAAKALLETAKADEMEARKEAFRLAFGGAAREGTNRIELNNGYALKGVRKVNYKVSASNEAVDAAEDRMPKIGNEATFLFERIITWTPDFSKSEYNKLDETNPTHKAVKLEIDMLIEKTDGAPTLVIEPPKGSK